MPGVLPGIHVFLACGAKDVDGRDIRAFTPVFDVLCPAMTECYFFLLLTSTPAHFSTILVISVKSEPGPFTAFAISHI